MTACLFMSAIFIASTVGCGGDEPASSATPDVDATVESAIRATSEAADAFETQVAEAVEATRQAGGVGSSTGVPTSTPLSAMTPLAPTTTIGMSCLQNTDCANGELCQGGVCVLEAQPTPTAAPSCFDDGDCPPGSQCQGGVCVPMAVSPVVTPLPTPYWRIGSVELRDIECVDFHPGVPPVTGPTRWYEVSGQISNINISDKSLVLRLQIIGSNGQVLSESAVPGLNIPPLQIYGFSEQFDLPSAPEGSMCRVTFSERDFAPSDSGVVLVELDQFFAP